MSIKFQSNGHRFSIRPVDANQRVSATELVVTGTVKADGFSFSLPAEIPVMVVSATKLVVNNVTIPTVAAVATLEFYLPPALHGKGFAAHIAIFKEIVAQLEQLPNCWQFSNNSCITITIEALKASVEKALQQSVEKCEEATRITFNGLDYEISTLPISIFLTRPVQPAAGEDSLKNPINLMLTKHELEVSYADQNGDVAFVCSIRLDRHHWYPTDVFVSQEKTKALFIALLEVLNRAPSFQAAVDELIKAILSSANHKE